MVVGEWGVGGEGEVLRVVYSRSVPAEAVSRCAPLPSPIRGEWGEGGTGGSVAALLNKAEGVPMWVSAVVPPSMLLHSAVSRGTLR